MNKSVNLTVLLDGEASVAEARGSTLNNIGELRGTGSAKKHPKDHSDDEVGFNLAVSRALRALADQYELRANQAAELTNYPPRYVLGMDPSAANGYIIATNPSLHSEV
jgi:hypothetical protein